MWLKNDQSAVYIFLWDEPLVLEPRAWLKSGPLKKSSKWVKLSNIILLAALVKLATS